MDNLYIRSCEMRGFFMEYNYIYNTALEKLEILYYFARVPVSLYIILPVVQFPESLYRWMYCNQSEPSIIFSKNHL